MLFLVLLYLKIFELILSFMPTFHIGMVQFHFHITYIDI